MLTHIHIRDFAIIEELEIELQPGMTALTGETGAGKSILLDAIGLVLGDKADSSTVRHGADRAEITLSANIATTVQARDWLLEQALLEQGDNTCILRRVISATGGKSRAWINGTPVTLNLLRELGEQMVDIHGQHEHQSLMRRDMQRELLDAYADSEPLLQPLLQRWHNWKTLHDRVEALSSESRQHLERLDLLRFQTGELELLALEAGEVAHLDEELSRLANAGELKQAAEQGYSRLYDEENAVCSLLGRLSQELEQLARFDEMLHSPAELVTSARIQLQEAAYLLRDYAGGLELDPERLHWVETRIADIRAMARKYRTEPEQLNARLTTLQKELAALDSSDYDLDALQDRLEQARETYLVQARKLTGYRLKAAEKLAKGVTAAMQQLGMQGGQFAVELSTDETRPFHPHGIDQLEFMVSANPGQPLKPLTRVASGGELSRISLAIQMIAARKMALPSLIFDEVDTGIGGGIAEMIGRQLRELGEKRQVLCVTHLPQVASQAHQQLKVTKSKSRNHTTTAIYPLSAAERVEEIARMLGGAEITETTRNLALEMLDNQ
ncbi:MAG: DNA repair protein RecN [Thiothrix sp.]|nr:DNA repair protein RecN [Thiothrix sp.]